MLHCDNIVICKDPRPSELPKFQELNEYADTVKYMKKMFTYKRDPKDERDFLLEGSFRNFQVSLSSIPPKVDYTNQMSPVKDQGYLGSCVGFAVTAMKEWQEQQEHEEEVAEGKRDTRKGREYDLSESWVYWNAKKIDAWPGEEGTSIRYAMKVLNKIGVPTEKAWPYDDVDFGKPKKWADMIARWALIDSYWRITTLEELKLALVDGPVPIGVPCFYEMFFVGDDGIIPYPENPNNIYGGHAICAIGYDNSTRLIKIKNSWGQTWGENGYGYLSYDYIEDFLWDAWTSKDLSVTREMLRGERSLL